MDHGLTEDAMEKMEGADELVESVKDKAAFVGDMFEVFSGMENGATEDFQFKGALKDIKIDGDSASAVLEDGGTSEPVQFKKVKGSWLIHLDPSEFGEGFLGN